MKWISVEERVPKIGTTVIAWKPTRDSAQIVQYTEKADDHRLFTRRDGQWWDNGSQITHWMRLPKAPESD